LQLSTLGVAIKGATSFSSQRKIAIFIAIKKQGRRLGDWAAAGGKGGRLVKADLLVFIKMLTFFNGRFWLCHKKLVATTKFAIGKTHIVERLDWIFMWWRELILIPNGTLYAKSYILIKGGATHFAPTKSRPAQLILPQC
jgi:hypothetical protein